MIISIFFFNDTATTEIYTLSLHDALPISPFLCQLLCLCRVELEFLFLRDHGRHLGTRRRDALLDRKSTRLNSSHANISYAVFCLKKKKHTAHYYKYPVVVLVYYLLIVVTT